VPYYREYFANRHVTAGLTSNGVPGYQSPVVLDSTEMLTHRSQPHEDALSAREVPDHLADPHAYFLNSQSKRRYHDRLKERGLPAQGSPDRGHSFELKKHAVSIALRDMTQTYTNSGGTYNVLWRNAFVLPGLQHTQLNHVHTGTIFAPAPYVEQGLEGFAQKAYSRSAPTSVMFDASTFLGELLEGLPRATFVSFENAGDFFRSLGGGYLNASFGWFPLLSDIKKAGEALKRATLALSQQGQRVHKKFSQPPTTRSDTYDNTGLTQLRAFTGWYRGFIPNPLPGFPNVESTSLSFPTRAKWSLEKDMSSERWFEGEFSFFYPLTFNPKDYLSRLDVLMNLELTPATLWELAPWSWMIDWFLGIQDTISSNQLAGNDHLIMHYGYAMEKTVYKTRLHWQKNPSDALPSGWTNFPTGGSVWNQTIYKRRIRANPYGFQVNPTGDLSGSQLAILGALGLSKAR